MFLRQALSYRGNGKKFSDKKMEKYSEIHKVEQYSKQQQYNSNVKRLCRDIKKVIWMKWRLSTNTKGSIRQVQRQTQDQKNFVVLYQKIIVLYQKGGKRSRKKG